MNSYLKSETFRVVRDKSYWIFMGVFALLAIAATVIIYMTNTASNAASVDFPYANTRFMLLNIATSIIIPFFFLYQIAQIVVGEEIKHRTLKNTVSFGVSRSTIFFGKWIVSVVGVFVLAITSISIALVFIYALLENSGTVFLTDFLMALVAFIPLMISGITLYHVLYFVSGSPNYAVMIFAGVQVLPYIVGKYIGGRIEILSWIYRHTPFYLFSVSEMTESRRVIMAGNTTEGMLTCWAVGGVLTVVFLTFGYFRFRKLEIK